jgi:hypothetical protein
MITRKLCVSSGLLNQIQALQAVPWQFLFWRLSVDSHKMDCTRHATKMPVLCAKLKAFSRTSSHEIFWHSIIISGVIGLVSAKKSYLNEQQNVYPALKTMVSERPHPNFRPSVSQPDDLPKMYSTVTAELVNG